MSKIITLMQFQSLKKAREYGPGGFVWAKAHTENGIDYPLRCQIFFPMEWPDNKGPTLSLANIWTTIHKWNGNTDFPSFYASIAIRTFWGQNSREIDLWHGYVISGLASEDLQTLKNVAVPEDVSWFNSHK